MVPTHKSRVLSAIPRLRVSLPLFFILLIMNWSKPTQTKALPKIDQYVELNENHYRTVQRVMDDQHLVST